METDLMRTLLVALILSLAPAALATHGTGNDDSDQASNTANCNASFQTDCPVTIDTNLSSNAVAAPIGLLGESAAELALMVAATAALFVLGIRRSRRPHALMGTRNSPSPR
jgi:hypothetical protein